MTHLLAGDDIGQLVVVFLVVLAFAAVLVLANLGEVHETARIIAYAGMTGLCAIMVVLAALNILTAQLPAARAANSLPAVRVIGGNLLWLLGAGCAPLLLVPAVRRRLGAVIHQFQPESSTNAVGAALYLAVAATFVSLQVSTDQLQAIKDSGTQPSLWYIVATNQLPMLILAFVGVGLFVRRGIVSTLVRLGLYWPGWRWVLGSLGVAVALVVFGVAFDYLSRLLTPGQSAEIDKVSQQLLSNVTSPLAAVSLALAAGIGEEVLLRGALQPRLGITAAALLFAILHTQYAISLASLEIFFLGVALGWLRNRAGTTGAVIAHAGYDLILLMIPFVAAHH